MKFTTLVAAFVVAELIVRVIVGLGVYMWIMNLL